LRAYASPVPLPEPSQGSLPAWAGSPLAGRNSHPLDDERSFTEASHPPILFDQPCLVALNALSAEPAMGTVLDVQILLRRY
jgi:hypothetical protein